MERAPAYDVIGLGYSATRREEPRIAQPIWDALGDATSVANIGAGTGNYEPRDREVIAVEPSAVMRAQRPQGAAPAIEGTAERIPLENESVDAAMAVMTDQHWVDRARGLEEMQRIARKRVVALAIDLAPRDGLLADAGLPHRVPAGPRRPGSKPLRAGRRCGHRPDPSRPGPHDCRDGFALSFWRRPEAYLDPAVRAGISIFHLLDQGHVESAMERLAEDLESGAWEQRNAELLELDELDLGLRLIVWEK